MPGAPVAPDHLGGVHLVVTDHNRWLEEPILRSHMSAKLSQLSPKANPRPATAGTRRRHGWSGLVTLMALLAATVSVSACGSGSAGTTSPSTASSGTTSAAMTSDASSASASSQLASPAAGLPSSASSAAGSAAAGRYVDLAAYEQDGKQARGTAVVLFFHAPWCPDCRRAQASLERDGVPEGLTVVKVDFDSRQDLRQRYGVTQQHTFVQVDPSGELIKRWTGSATGAAIKAQVA